MRKSTHTKGVPRPGNNIHIPLETDEAICLLLKVKPTKDMPRPGTNPTKPRAKRTKKRTKAR
jgi:hypothetical protein